MRSCRRVRESSAGPARAKTPTAEDRLIALAAALVVVVGAAAIYAFTINRSLSHNIHLADTLPAGNPSEPSVNPEARGALNYLLLGSDSRDPNVAGAGRSDSIMLVHLDEAHDKAYVISLPRDLYVDIPGHGRTRSTRPSRSAAPSWLCARCKP